MKPKSIVNIREQNISSVYRQLFLDGEITRNGLAAKSGLSLMTISNLMDILLEKGVVEEEKYPVKAAGRTPQVIRIRPDSRYCLVVDITVRDFRFYVLDMGFHVVCKGEHVYQPHRSLEGNLRMFFESTVRDMPPACRDNLIGTGFSAVSEFDAASGRIHSKAIPEFYMLDLMALARAYFAPPIFLHEDVKLAAKAILYKQAYNDLAYVFMGNGIGAGIVVSGEVLGGHHGAAGELGQLDLGGQTLEERAAFPAFRARVAAAFPQCRDEDFLEETLRLLRKGDARFMKIFEDICLCLAKGISALVYLVDPETIILEGEYSYFGNHMLQCIEKHLQNIHGARLVPAIQWDESELKTQNSIMGCAILLIDDFIARET